MLTADSKRYLVLTLTLGVLAFAYFSFPLFRFYLAIAIGLSYFLWGLIIHSHDKNLHLQVILEYLGISLLAIIILIFLSLRA